VADKEATPKNDATSDATEEQSEAAPKKRAAGKRGTGKTASGSTRSRKTAAKSGGRKPRASAKAAPDAPAAETGSESAPAAEEKQAQNPKKPTITARPRTRLEQAYASEVTPTLLSEFGYKNPMEIPRPVKIVLNIGIGEVIGVQGRLNMDIVQRAQDDLATITGQHPVVTKAKKSIANFKLRDGMPVGVTVTLRDLKMWQFLDRLLNIALPRVRDFHGVSRTSFDGRGNYALGLTDQIVFPEIDYNRIDRLRGLQVNIVTSARNDEEARRLLELLGMPFARVVDQVPAAV
jgi:large subunit ribosomal protein L5